MSRRQCAACGQYFVARPQSPDQRFCSKPECQQERRRVTRLSHKQADPAAAAELARAWAGLHPDYWKRYRDARPGSVERNMVQQQRNQKRRAGTAAAADALPSGRYLLTPLDAMGDCKGNAYLVEILVLPGLASDG